MTLRILIEAKNNPLVTPGFDERIHDALEILKHNPSWPLLEPFVHILRKSVPLYYLATLSPQALSDWCLRLYDFLCVRTEDLKIETLPIGRNRSLVLTNSPDVPYLLDTLQSVFDAQGIKCRLVCHPSFVIEREDGALVRLDDTTGSGVRESLVIFELDARDADLLAKVCMELRGGIEELLRIHKVRNELFLTLKGVSEFVEEKYHNFLLWLSEEGFHTFACRSFELEKKRDALFIAEVDKSGRGLSGAPMEPSTFRQRPLADFPRDFQLRMGGDEPVIVETLDRLSPVLRRERLISVVVRESVSPDRWRIHEFLGLFRRRGVEKPAYEIPPLRDRIERSLLALGVMPDSYDWRKTVEMFNAFPKVELFFMDDDELQRIIRSFTLVYRRGTVKVFAAHSPSVGALTLLALVPRGYYAADMLGRTERFLCRYFKGAVVSQKIVQITEDTLSLHVTVKPGCDEIRLDVQRVETGIFHAARPWDARLKALVTRSYGDVHGEALWSRYAEAFPKEYRTIVHPRFALRDISQVERLLETKEEVLDFWGPFGREGRYRILFYSLERTPLNALMPFMENLGLNVTDEVDFVLSVDGMKIHIKSFGVDGGTYDLAPVRENLLETLRALRMGDVENDYLNRLILPTGLSWREVDIFRGYRNYYFQLGCPYTKKRVAFALIHNPEAALFLFRYFEGRFRDNPDWSDPVRREEEALFPIRQNILTSLSTVKDINEDDILRSLFNLIDSTVRTNFFLRRDRPDYFFSFKISAIGIIDMPAPRPLYEIYVHSATMEGIHLRGGKVARGGLRWSDRPDDFRTEVLGLMKTQMTKNALIVPVGSKGGFVVKAPFSDRETGMLLASEAYKTLIRGLLDLTDNRKGSEIIRPEGVVAYDEEDPYLVVAADKGTAHLSDTANAVANEYGFWLGDAFASGGSHGYDHKKLGITARGAWECVKAHFRETGRDIQSEPFTVVGIGDMSGDVFGNGMLLSRQIRLLGAFDHRHIFLDPDPDPERSFEERKRLFALPRSSWSDYDLSLISPGGGVFPRDAKDIPLSDEVRRWLGVRHASIDGPGLIRILLCASVDLLWNGGIGTYVKASSEKNSDVGDRANDSLRIDATELRAKVAGEGGNLGFTQRARIEYALAGGRINTDAVDNSGGVDCSDHEVNLKILFSHLLKAGEIASLDERDRIIDEVSESVCEMVLDDNVDQSLCLSLDLARSLRDVTPFVETQERLARGGLLDRRGEYLPTEKEILARPDSSYTRPELAILMAYSKMFVYRSVLESALPENPTAVDDLSLYFPLEIRERFAPHFSQHPLKREIIATVMTNRVVNQGGSSLVPAVTRQTGAGPADVVAAYLAFDHILDGKEIRKALRDGNTLTVDERGRYLLALEDLLSTFCLRAFEGSMFPVFDDKTVASLRDDFCAYTKVLGTLLPSDEWAESRAEFDRLQASGLDPDVAETLSLLDHIVDFLSVSALASRCGTDIFSSAQTFIETSRRLDIATIESKLAVVPLRGEWDRRTLSTLREDFSRLVIRTVAEVISRSEGNLDAYMAQRRRSLSNYKGVFEQLRVEIPQNFHPFTVVLKALSDLLE